MNKKLVLSVLSTAVVASMTSAAFAKAEPGFYVGGNVDKYYSITAFLKNQKQALSDILKNIDKTTFVPRDGKAASFKDAINTATPEALEKVLHDVTKADFEANPYTIVGGTGTYDPSTDKDLPGTVTGDLKVDSVSAINLTQVKVQFSSGVSEASAENAANYTISGYAGTIVPTLLEDGKTVVLTISTQTQSSKATVSVANVQNDDGKKIETNISDVTFADVTAPTVSSVAAAGNKSIVVTLSEPVAGLTAADFKLNGNDLSLYGGLVPGTGFAASVGTTDDVPTNQQYTLTFNNALPAGTHNLQFASATARVDAAGFPLASVTKAFTVDGVTTAPVATVSSAKSGAFGTVTVTFDHKMNASTLAGNFFLNDTSIPTSSAPVLGADGKTVTLTFANVPAGANLLLINPAVADTYGNKVTTATTPVRVNFTASADTQAPTLLSATSATETAVTLNFDEAVDALTANNSANYVITDASGTKVAPLTTRTLTPVRGGTGNKQVAITLGSKLPGGTYTVTVTGVKDTAGNAITSAAKTFTVTDLTAPGLANKDGLGNAAVHNAANHTVEVFFTEAMQTTGAYSILDKANWQYKGANLPTYVTLSAGANNKSAIFQFAATDAILATDTFTALVVKDVAGNTARNLTTTVAAAASVDAPVILDGTVKAQAGTTSTDVLTFEVDQPLVSLAADDFAVSVNGGTAIYPTGATLNGTTVTLTFANGALADGRNITVNVTGVVDTKNAKGGSLATETGSALDADDVIAPVATTADITALDQVTIHFNEPLNGGLGALFKSDFAIDNNGATIAAARSSVNGNDLVLTLPTGKTFTGTVTVYPVAQPANVQDLAGNKFVPTSTQVASGISAAALPVPSTAPQASAITVTNNSVGTDDTVAVTGLAAGDVVKVYSDAAATTQIGTATVAAGQTSATVTIPQVGATAGNVYVTVTSTGKTESTATGKAFTAEAPLVATAITAQFDGLAMTNLAATVDTSVTKVEVYKSGTQVVTKTLSNETSYTDTVVGLAVGDVLTIKFFVGATEAQSTNVTVQ